LQNELKEAKEIHARWKEQAGETRLILKDKMVISIEEVDKPLEEVEKATTINANKGKKQNDWRRIVSGRSWGLKGSNI